MSVFRNAYLSVSRLKLFEQCPRAFYYRYVAKGPELPGDPAAGLGTCCHTALERTYRQIQEAEHEGIFPTSWLERHFQDAWTEDQMTNVSLYEEGRAMLRSYGARQGTVSHWDVLATEHEFRLTLGEFSVEGSLDLVLREKDAVRIVDFKSNRTLYTQDELDQDLQLPVYGLVARRDWPWAKAIRFGFDMLRHGQQQEVVRTPASLNVAGDYAVSLGRQIESERPDGEPGWPAVPQVLCSYCRSRLRCPEYQAALEAPVEPLARPDLLPARELVRRREALAARSKTIFRQVNALDRVILARVADGGPFVEGDMEYRQASPGVRYPDVGRVVGAFERIAKLPDAREQLHPAIPPAAVAELRAALEPHLHRGQIIQLDAALAAAAVPDTPKYPKVEARSVKKRW